MNAALQMLFLRVWLAWLLLSNPTGAKASEGPELNAGCPVLLASLH